MRPIKSASASKQPKLYNVAVYMPDALRAEIAALTFSGRLSYTRHSLSEILSDRYGNICPTLLPRNVTISEWELVEAEVTERFLTKLVLRKAFDSTRSIVMVILPFEIAVVKTCWINQNADNHRTLNRSNYATV